MFIGNTVSKWVEYDCVLVISYLYISDLCGLHS